MYQLQILGRRPAVPLVAKNGNNRLLSALPLVVLLPGLEGTGELLSDFQSHIADLGYQSCVIAYPKDELLGYTELTDYVQQRLPSDTDFILMGESFGGPLATFVAKNNPAHCVGLVLAATFLRSRNTSSPFMSFAMKRPPFFKLPKSVTARMLAGMQCPHDLLSKIYAMFRSSNQAVIRHRSEAALQVDATCAMRAVKAPVLALHASHDWIVPVMCREDAVLCSESLTMHTVYGPHLVLATNASGCASIFDSWWTSVRKQNVKLAAA